MQTVNSYLSAGKAALRVQLSPKRLLLPERLMAPPIPALESQWALFLDVDGTLLDLESTPDSVKVPDGLIDLLAHLHKRLGGALALVSGRRIETLDSLFKPLILPCVGLHGVEWRDTEGHEYRTDVNTTALQMMRIGAKQLVDALPSVLMEDKIFSMAFHYRKARKYQTILKDQLESIARETGFIVQSGIDVYELRPPGSDKGSALEKIMRDRAFRHRLPIYIGDDTTDENALFAAQKFAGIGIHVGAEMPSIAHFGLPSPGAVLHWLHRWNEQLS